MDILINLVLPKGIHVEVSSFRMRFLVPARGIPPIDQLVSNNSILPMDTIDRISKVYGLIYSYLVRSANTSRNPASALVRHKAICFIAAVWLN